MIFYFHLKKQTIVTVQLTYRIIEMVGCQKSAHQAGRPLLHLHSLLIFKHCYPHSHKHTVYQQYKQVKGPNNIIMHYARKHSQLQIYSIAIQQ